VEEDADTVIAEHYGWSTASRGTQSAIQHGAHKPLPVNPRNIFEFRSQDNISLLLEKLQIFGSKIVRALGQVVLIPAFDLRLAAAEVWFIALDVFGKALRLFRCLGLAPSATESKMWYMFKISIFMESLRAQLAISGACR
jgi:hypothetical protein